MMSLKTFKKIIILTLTVKQIVSKHLRLCRNYFLYPVLIKQQHVAEVDSIRPASCRASEPDLMQWENTAHFAALKTLNSIKEKVL